MLVDRDTLFELADKLGGVPVLGCLPGSPAARGGFRYGDIILRVAGKSTSSLDEYFDAFGASDDDPTPVRIFRDGEERVLYIDRRGWQRPSPIQAVTEAARAGLPDHPPSSAGDGEPEN